MICVSSQKSGRIPTGGLDVLDASESPPGTLVAFLRDLYGKNGIEQVLDARDRVPFEGPGLDEDPQGERVLQQLDQIAIDRKADGTHFATCHRLI